MNRLARFIWIAVLFSSGSTFGSGDEKSFVSMQKPSLMGSKLSAGNYLPVTTYQTTTSPAVYLDFDLIRSEGIEVRPEGYTPELLRKVSDAFGWVIKVNGEKSTAFSGRTRTMYVDLYGAYETGKNIGSGRAAEIGKWQTKSIGPTPAVFEDGSRGHANGLGNLVEAMIDSIWTKINQVELPYGSVPIMGIFERDTGLVLPNGAGERAAFYIREAPVRPGHFVPVRSDSPIQIDQNSPEDFARRLANSLPVPADYEQSPAEAKLRQGLFEYVKRLAKQMGVAYGHKMDHLSMGLSNYDISGRYLDFGTQSTFPAYGKIRLVDWNDPAGETTKTEKAMIKDFVEKLYPQLPEKLKSAMPSAEELAKAFRATHLQTVRREFLLHTGVPENIVDSLMSRKEYLRLADLLRQLATEGGVEFIAKALNKFPEKGLTRYDFGKIVSTIMGKKSSRMEDIISELPQDMPAAQREELARLLESFLKDSLSEASKYGISKAAFWQFLNLKSHQRNKNRPDLFRANLIERLHKTVGNYEKSRDASVIRNAIDEVVQKNALRSDPDKPFQVVLDHQRNVAQDSEYMIYFDAKTGQYHFKSKFNYSRGKLWLIDRSLKTDDPAKLKASINDGHRSVGLNSSFHAGERHLIVEGPIDEFQRSFNLTVRTPSGRKGSLAVRRNAESLPAIYRESCAESIREAVQRLVSDSSR